MRGKIYIFGMRITSTNIFLLVLLIITKSLDVFPTGDVDPLDLIRNDPEAPLEQQQKPHLDILGQSIPSYGSNFTIWSNFFYFARFTAGHRNVFIFVSENKNRT